MFGRKKENNEISSVETSAVKEEQTLDEEIEYTNNLKTDLEKKYSYVVYWCQAVSLIICALCIPQTILNREPVLMALLIAASLCMIFPMFYVSVVNEYIKRIRKKEKQKNTEEPSKVEEERHSSPEEETKDDSAIIRSDTNE